MGRMQKELHTGIDLAVALIKQDTLPALLNTATSQLQKAFGLTKCWALELDLSGRTLHCGQLGDTSEFDCGDFSHPFAHVLQTGQPRELTRAASYRLDHPGFQTLFDASDRPRSLWLEPLAGEDGRTLGILVLCGDHPDWQGIVGQPLYAGIKQLLVHQWISQLQTRDQVWQRRMLKRSLDHLHDAETLRQRCEQLAHTLVGNSEAMVNLRAQVVRAAGSQLSVLIQAKPAAAKTWSPAASTTCLTGRVALWWWSTAPPSQTPCWKANCSAIPKALSPARTRPKKACWHRPMAAPCSWMKSVTCPWPCNPSCCGYWKAASSAPGRPG